eukprot:COSAG06_NODE_51490_length_311_cov_30.858491_1_plen_63_part_10
MIDPARSGAIKIESENHSANRAEFGCLANFVRRYALRLNACEAALPPTAPTKLTTTLQPPPTQ